MQGAWQTPRSTWRRLAPELTHRSRIPPRPRGKRLLPVRCGHERRRVHVARQLQQSRAAGGASAADDDSASFVDLPRVWLVNNLARKLDTCSAPEAQPAKLPTPAEQVQLGLAAPPGSVEPKATQGGERTGGDVNEVLTTMTSGNGGEGSLGVGGGGKELAQVLVGIDAFVQRGYAAVLARMQDEFAVLDPTANAWRGRQTRWEEVEAPFLASTFAVALRSDYSLLSRSEAEFVEATQNSKSLPIEIEWNNIQGGLLRFANPFEATGVDPPPFADRLLVFHRGVGVRRVRGYFYAEKMDELFSRATEWLRSVILTPPSRALARLLRVEHTGEVEARKEQPHERTGVADLPLGFRQVLRQVELVEPTFRSVILVWRESESITGTQTALLRFAVAAHNRLLRVTAKVASAAKTVALHSEDLANESTTRVGKKLARGAHSVTKRARRLTKRVRNKVASADAITLLGGRVRVPFRPDGQAVLHWKGHGHYGADDADEQESGMWGDDAGGLDGDDTVAAWVPTTTRDANSNAEKYGTFALYDHPLVQQAIENAQELADEKESSSATSHQVDADWESLKRVRIFVKELKDVPMSELKLAFPHLRLAMSALDKLRLSFLGGACGLSGWHLISEETVVSTTAVVALTSFVVVSSASTLAAVLFVLCVTRLLHA